MASKVAVLGIADENHFRGETIIVAGDTDAKVIVQVFGTDMPMGGCGCGSGCCGPAPEPTDSSSMDEQAAELGQRLARYYGNDVAVEYVDIFSRRMGEFPSVLRVIGRGNVPLPVIGFIGEARLAGGISIEMISEELEKMGVVPVEETADG